MDPLVLLHGFGGRGSSWDSVLTALMEVGLDQPVDGWSPDLPGHGSSKNVRPESFEATVKALGRSIAERYDRPVVLAGYSLGGRLALGVALEHPRLIRHLILIGTQPGLVITAERRARADVDAKAAERLQRQGLEAFFTEWQQQPLFADQNRLPGEVLVRQRRTRMSNDVAGLAWALKVLSPGLMPDYRARLLSWSAAPVTMVTGEDDTKFHAIADEMSRRSDHIEHRSVPGCGHNPLLADPAAVARILARILNREADA